MSAIAHVLRLEPDALELARLLDVGLADLAVVEGQVEIGLLLVERHLAAVGDDRAHQLGARPRPRW